MLHFQRVLCPVDHSEPSRQALEYAIAIARWHDAQLTLLHVVPVVTPASVLAPQSVAGPGDMAPDAAPAEERLRASAEPLRDGLRVTTTVASGPVVEGILDHARTTSADLIVLGTHGRSGFSRLVLGSTTERVLRQATSPVLTVPPRVKGPAPEAMEFKRILCPLDFSQASLSALEYALSFAQASDANLTLVHALEELEEEPTIPTSFAVPEYRLLREQEAWRRLSRLVPANATEWCRPETIVVAGTAHREVLRVAEQKRADLIVMGVHGRSAMDLMFFGSTAHHVVRHARCPVLTIRPRRPSPEE